MICCCSLAAAERADANDGGHERDADLDRPMDSDEERDFASYDMISYTISLLYYDIIYDIIYDIVL